MKKYFRLNITTKDDEAYVDDVNVDKIMRRKFLDGKDVEVTFPVKANLKNKTKEKPDLMGDSISCPIVSEKLKIFLEIHSDKNFLKFIDCEISDSKKLKYFLLILLNPLDINKIDSEYTFFNNDINDVDEITKLVIDENSAGNRNIFRISQDRYHIFVDENLKNKIEENGFSGIDFNANMNLTTNKKN